MEVMNSPGNDDVKLKDVSSEEPDEASDNKEAESAMDELTEECCDPYFYTKRDEFTSEVFKIEVEHLPRVVGYNQIKKLLTKNLKLKPHKIKVVGKAPGLVFVTFRCEEDREAALQAINKYVWKGRNLSAKKASPMADPLVKKRKADLSKNSDDTKKIKTDDEIEVPIPIMVKSAITPLWHFSYEEQLESKQKEMTNFMEVLTSKLINMNPALRKNNLQQNTLCPLLPILGSPVTCEYRNKCEFNVGLHPESAKPTVGFRISSYKEGSKCVAEASHCNNVPQNMLRAAELFQAYIRASTLTVYNPENHEGVWRQLTARGSRKGHLLLIVVIHPQNMTEEEIEEEKHKLKEHFSSSDLEVTSLYFQKFIKKEKEEPPLEHVDGSTFIEEDLLGLTFRISPDAFFQVNTQGAEVLYKTVKEFASLTKDTTVLDLCCGTGTIGICLAKDVSKVIGVELCQAAVEDARHNVDANGIENAEFICGKVEDVIFKVLDKAAEGEDIVAVLDPPRAGLSNKVIRAIRGMPKLKRLVYLSCSPKLAMTNFVDLCRPSSNNYRGTAFQPVKAVVMDLFPQTNHCELIMLFERQ